MDQQTLIRGFCLPKPDIAALSQGRTILALASMFVRPQDKFALIPTEQLIAPTLSAQDNYQDKALSLVSSRTTLEELNSSSLVVNTWAECISCKPLQKGDKFDSLYSLSIWSEAAIYEQFENREFIFIVALRVYNLEQLIFDRSEINISESGRYTSLPRSITVDTQCPVLSDRSFEQRLEYWNNSKVYPLEYLERLENSLALNCSNEIAANKLQFQLRHLLDWKQEAPNEETDPSFEWINNIVALGNRSKQEDQGKSNYQAGTDFEIAVRDSLTFLGFTVDNDHKGGAGGLDLFCSKPYALVGECKSGKKIPNGTAIQLLNLGTLRLASQGKKAYQEAVKLIIGPGEPTSQLEDVAIVHGMSILNPATLQRLVQLNYHCPGSVDLFELREYLTDGRSDDSVNEYIDNILSQFKLRSFIVNKVKEYQDNAKAEDANIDSLHAIYIVSRPSVALTRQQFLEILIELSSPLAGYLGRRKGEDGTERFYFLRNLSVPSL